MFEDRPRSIAFVLWSGEYGGAETWMLRLARALAAAGIRTGLVFICSGGPIANAADHSGIPTIVLSMGRGRQALLRCRRLARAVHDLSSEAVIVPTLGYLCRALRSGGYRGVILGVEHGALLQLEQMPWRNRLLRHLDLAIGHGAADVGVTPSDYMASRLRSLVRCPSLLCIRPGINVGTGSRLAQPKDRLQIGFAGRLIHGKGLDILLAALAKLTVGDIWQLRVAGDGPQRAHLENMARQLKIGHRVRFDGWVDSIGTFWGGCDLAVVPSSTWVESFGMVAIEAMAAGIPVIASRQGGLPEVVADGMSGALFEPGNVDDLTSILQRYLSDRSYLRMQGEMAYARCREHFDINVSARRFHTAIRDAME